MIKNISIPKGTRDFSPEEVVKRKYIFNTIEKIFQLYGYMPIETPAMENLSTLTGKYGDEGDRLIFKILNSGNFLDNVDLSEKNQNKIGAQICEKALRYDLTVPFARYVVMNQNEITFPFKRYQLQPVWRADKPQKGRYREFFQCDVDVIGSNSLLNEVELIQIIDRIFNELNINVKIKVNNRKILSGIAEIIGEKERITDITVSIDKIEKIGFDKVVEELLNKGISKNAVEKLKPVINIKGGAIEKLKQLKDILKSSETGMKGVEEAEAIFNCIGLTPTKSEVEIDLNLARGLDYYTGTIIEVSAKDSAIGSVCGGGRYDDLTGIFGLPDVSGVGVSFGADRIYDVLTELNLFPEKSETTTKLLFINFGKEEEKYCLKIISEIRNAGISSELYPEPAKLKRQMSYADNKKIPFVALIGSEEMQSNLITLKDMKSGEQKKMSMNDLLGFLKSHE
ncbi:MAG: histidine--tRNA ligase [Bacteroidales bacterium]|nr:histidine--tRNA ligase [Bacteroidales bacterium]